MSGDLFHLSAELGDAAGKSIEWVYNLMEDFVMLPDQSTLSSLCLAEGICSWPQCSVTIC